MPTKAVIFVLYLNKFSGMDVNEVQLAKHPTEYFPSLLPAPPFVVAMFTILTLLSNSPDGMDVKEEHSRKVLVKSVASVLLENNVAGIDVREEQSLKHSVNFVTAVLLENNVAGID